VKKKLLAILMMVVMLAGMMGTALAEDPVEIRIMTGETGDNLRCIEVVAERFNETNDKNIHVSVLCVPEEYDAKLISMVAANDIPEVAWLESGTVLYPLAADGVVADINEYAKNDPTFDWDAISPTFQFRSGDKWIAYGIGSENIIMFYNTALFEKYGVEEPSANWDEAWDWDTFVETAQKLTIDANGNNALSPDFDPENIKTYGVNFSKWWATYMPFILSAGADFLTEDGTQIGYATEAGIDVFQKLQDLIYKYHVAPTPTASSTFPGMSEVFATGKVAMIFDGQWSNAGLMADEVEYNVAPLPKIGEEARTIITHGGVGLLNTPHTQEGYEFLKYFYTEVGIFEIDYLSGSWLPTNMHEFSDEVISSYITDAHPENYYETVVTAQIDGTAEPTTTGYVKNFNEINDVLSAALDELWSGEKTAQEVFDGVKDTANALVEGYQYER